MLIFVLDYIVKMVLPRVKHSTTQIPKTTGGHRFARSPVNTHVFHPGQHVPGPAGNRAPARMGFFAIFLFALALTKRLQVESDTLWRATILIVLAALAMAVMLVIRR